MAHADGIADVDGAGVEGHDGIPLHRLTIQGASMSFHRISLLVGLALVSVATLAQAKDPPDYAALIEALASRNSEPDTSDGKPRPPAGFDWKDPSRVADAFHQLCHDGSDELWEELLKHLDDKRYSLTMEFNDSGDWTNESVGDLCRMLAYKHLADDVLDRYIPRDRPTRLIKELWTDLGEWRKARADKSLYELQIEVCELGLPEVANLPDWVSDEKKDKTRHKIEAQIDELKMTKKAAYRPLVLDSYKIFGPKPRPAPNPPRTKKSKKGA